MFKKSCRLPVAWRDVVEILLALMTDNLQASQELQTSCSDAASAAATTVIEEVRTIACLAIRQAGLVQG